MDLVIHRPSRLIRVATHGRGSFMRMLGAPGAVPPVTMAPVQLLVREHQLDLGLGPEVAADLRQRTCAGDIAGA